MRTNKAKLTEIINEHLDAMKKDISQRMNEQIGNDEWHKSKTIEDYERILINTYSSSVDWLSTHTGKPALAWVRPDILRCGMAVPVGNDYYSGKQPLPYRWLDDDEAFEIFYDGAWVEAQSIDWEFDKPEGEDK